MDPSDQPKTLWTNSSKQNLFMESPVHFLETHFYKRKRFFGWKSRVFVFFFQKKSVEKRRKSRFVTHKSKPCQIPRVSNDKKNKARKTVSNERRIEFDFFFFFKIKTSREQRKLCDHKSTDTPRLNKTISAVFSSSFYFTFVSPFHSQQSVNRFELNSTVLCANEVGK